MLLAAFVGLISGFAVASLLNQGVFGFLLFNLFSMFLVFIFNFSSLGFAVSFLYSIIGFLVAQIAYFVSLILRKQQG